MTKKNAVSVNQLTKIYTKKTNNPVVALNELNLEVKEGEIFGLLGPNGAGKTTFINILSGTVVKTKGIVNVWGFDVDKNPRQVRASIGIVPQEVNLDAFFSPRKLLERFLCVEGQWFYCTKRLHIQHPSNRHYCAKNSLSLEVPLH